MLGCLSGNTATGAPRLDSDPESGQDMFTNNDFLNVYKHQT